MMANLTQNLNYSASTPHAELTSILFHDRNNSSTANMTTTIGCVSILQRYNNSETEFLEDHIPSVIDASRILPPIWWVVGIVGNILALLVWLQPKMRHSSGYYLAALALSDLCFLPLNIIYEVNYTHRNHILDKPVLCEWFAVSYFSVQYLSPVLVLAFTVERYLSVCHPFRMVKFNHGNSMMTILVIVCLTIFCVGLSAIQGYFWTTYHEDDRGVCDLRSQVLESGVWTVWAWATEMLIFAAVPLAILILNILVIIEVSNISKLERRNMRTNSIDRRSTTFMLLGVSFYQILTVLPVTVVYSLYQQFPSGDPCMSNEEIVNDPTWKTYLQYFGTRTVIQNIGMSHYAANFFIYLFTGKIFRKQLYEMFFLFCCKEKLRYYIGPKTASTRMTRMSLTSHRGSIARGKAGLSYKATDQCNNDTEMGNKNSMYSMADLETLEASTFINSGHNHHTLRNHGAQSRLLPCVEETDGDFSDKESSNAEEQQPQVS